MKIRADFLVAGGALATAVARNIDQARIAGERVGPFVLTTLIGRGGMGEVWGADRHEGGFSQRVAIKFAQAARLQHGSRLLDRERAILASLDHPHIARLIDGGQTADGELWFALEWVDGPSLEAKALGQREGGRLALFDQVASAVEYAHSRLVIHRDLKPANIRISRNGVKLLDFGISALLSELEADDTGGYFTPAWASPEQARGEPTGTASDIYQLGRLLCHLLDLDSQAPALRSATDPATATPAAAPTVLVPASAGAAGESGPGSAAPAPRSSVRMHGAELLAIVAKATAEAASHRYPTVTALRDDLAKYRRGKPVGAYGQGPWYAMRCFVRRHRWGVAAVAATVLVAAIGLLAFISALNAARLEAQREAAIAAVERQRAEKTARFLERILIEASPTQASGERPTVDVVLNRARARLAAEFASEPALRVRLLVLIARVDIEHEKHADALDSLREARTLAALDPDSTDGARLEMLYAAALHQTGASSEALTVLARMHRIEVDDPRLTNQIARNYAQVLYQTGAVDQAIAIQAAAVAAIGHDDAPLRIANLINLGQMQASAGSSEAATTLGKALDLSRQTHGDRHPHTLLAASTNVVMLADAKRGDEAVALAAQTRSANAEVYGQSSPHHANAVMAHGYALHRSGQSGEAERVYREALAFWQALPAASDLNSATVLQLLGDLAADAGDHAQALAWYQQMQARNRDGRHAADPELGQRALRLARTHRQLGQCAEARDALDVAQARAAAAPATHPVHGQIALEAEQLAQAGCT